MDYETILRLGALFGNGNPLEPGMETPVEPPPVAVPTVPEAPTSPSTTPTSKTADAKKAPSFTNEQLMMLARLGAGGQSPLYPAPGAPSARPPHIGALTPLPTAAPIARKRQGLSEIIYGRS